MIKYDETFKHRVMPEDVSTMDLQELREEINGIDREIVDLYRKRLETAHALIRQGYSVLSAGYSSGFSDYSAFYRAFCHLYGQAPSAFSSQTRKTSRRRVAPESEE